MLRFGLTLRFGIAAFASMAILGVVLVVLLSRSITEHALADVQAEARDTVARRVLNHLAPSDLTSPMSGQQLTDFDRFVQESVLSGRTAHVVVWNREGRIIFSDDASQIGALLGIDGDRAEALSGKTVSDLPQSNALDDFGRQKEHLIEVYAPIVFSGSSEVAGIFEIYQTAKPVTATIAALRRDGIFALAAGLAILYLLLLGIVHGGARTIYRQHRDLEKAFKKQAEAEAARAQLADIVEATPDIITTTETDGKMRYLNQAGRRALGLSPEELVSSRNILEFYPSPAGELIQDEAVPFVLRKGSWAGESAMLGKGGKELPVSVVMLFHKGEGAGGGYVSTVARDISEQKRLEERLLQLANHDALTDLFNRRRFTEELESQLAYARNSGTELGLLFLDLDGFKGVNDSAGHFVGNELLASLSGVLLSTVRESGIIGRMGGDEFAILVPETDVLQAEVTARRLLQAVRKHRLLTKERAIGVTASIGIAVYPHHGTTAEELLQHADLAMYVAKETKNSLSVYTPALELGTESTARYAWEQRIRDGLEQNQFFLVAQRIRDLRKNVDRYEILLRLRGENGEDILPGAFLGYAERSGLIHDIDRWVVRHAIEAMHECRASGKDVAFSVNLSAKAFGDKELLPLIQRELARTKIDPSTLTFEITETAAIADLNEAVAFITRLRALGCRFAIDDFGVGYASFSYLKHLPVDELKIDGSFIQNLLNDPVDQYLVEIIVQIARGLGKQTVAEFVENQETLELISRLGVDCAQGYHIGRPEPLADILHDNSQAA